MLDSLFEDIDPSFSSVCEKGEQLSVYLDGELPLEDQAELFAHLATCNACRETMDAVLHFRRISRQETLLVPASVDEDFFQRLAEHKNKTDKLKVERAVDRSPLWRLQKPVSLGAAILATALVFVVGLLAPAQTQTVEAALFVSGEQEFVEFPEMEFMHEKTIYVFYPGLEVEASQAEEALANEHL